MLTWQELVTLSNEKLAAIDLAEQSFSLAMGLPGSEQLRGVEHRGKLLDKWAKQARRMMKSHYPPFANNPAAFQNSISRYRVLALVTVLQRDLSIRYDPRLVDRNDFFVDSRNVFLHGAIDMR